MVNKFNKVRSKRRVKRRSIKRSSRRMSRRRVKQSKKITQRRVKRSKKITQKRVKRNRRNSRRVVRGGSPWCGNKTKESNGDVARRQLAATMREKGIPLEFTDETGEKYIDKGIKFETILGEWQNKIEKDKSEKELERRWLADRERNTGQNTTVADVVMDAVDEEKKKEADQRNIRSKVIQEEIQDESDARLQAYIKSKKRAEKAAQDRAAAASGQAGFEHQVSDYSLKELNRVLAGATEARVRRAEKLGV